MKRLLFILLLIPFLGFAQSSPIAFKGANTIIIHTQDSSQVAFKKLARAFVDAGLSIANADKELGSINSNPKATKSATCLVNGSIIEDSNCKIVLAGTFQVSYAQALVGHIPTYQISLKGMNGSEAMNTWVIMAKVAKSYPNATLTFEKR